MSNNEVTVFEEAFLSKLAELEAGAAPSPAIDKLASAYGFDQGLGEVTYESLLDKLAASGGTPALAGTPTSPEAVQVHRAERGAGGQNMFSSNPNRAKGLNAGSAARANVKARHAFGAAKGYVGRHPGAYGAAAGALGAGALGYAAYKAMKSKKDDE